MDGVISRDYVSDSYYYYYDYYDPCPNIYIKCVKIIVVISIESLNFTLHNADKILVHHTALTD